MDAFKIDDYLGCITSQHRDKPKYIELVSATLQPLLDLNLCLSQFEYNFDINFAVGKQLDVLGDIFGASRIVDFELIDGTNRLEDDDYRMLIKSKMAQNHWDGTTEGLYAIWNSMFPDIKLTLIDNQDMTCIVVVDAEEITANQIRLLMNSKLIPRPVGVEYSYIFADRIVFAFDMDTLLFKGWDLGYWGGNRSNHWKDIKLLKWVNLEKFTWNEVEKAQLI